MKDVLPYCLAFLVRWLCFILGPVNILEHRVEVVTPLTSWIRFKECLALVQHGMSPYIGDICHQPPLMITVFIILEEKCVKFIPYIFMLSDIFGAYILSKSSKCFVEDQLKKQKLQKYDKDIGGLLWTTEDVQNLPSIVRAMYLFNIFSIVTCLACSTTSLMNFFISLALFFLVKGHYSLATISVAFLTYLSLYPLMLLAPVILHLAQSNEKLSLRKLASLLLVFLLSSACLLFGSYIVFESWEFIDAVYMFVLKVPDLTPNMGLFWYFFLEIFEHFRVFFLWVFQLHAFFYLIPFPILFRNRPIFLFYLILSTISWCKSYPSVGDLVIPLSLLPLWSNTFQYFRSTFVSVMMLCFSTILAPILYHLWVYSGSGNANFFYASTLAFNLSQILLLSDVTYAFLRREFHLKHGLNPLTENGEEGLIVMK